MASALVGLRCFTKPRSMPPDVPFPGGTSRPPVGTRLCRREASQFLGLARGSHSDV